MITFILGAMLSLSHIETLPAYGEYRTAVERCTPGWSPKQAQQLRAAFGHSRPNRDITFTIEEHIASETGELNACLDDVAQRVVSAAANPKAAEAFGPAGAAPWLADIGKRRNAAGKEIRASLVELGYRRSNAQVRVLREPPVALNRVSR